MTQCEKIVDYIDEFGEISPVEAFSDLGVMRLASRIHDLKRQGYNIVSETRTSKNRYGDPVSFKVYRFAN